MKESLPLYRSTTKFPRWTSFADSSNVSCEAAPSCNLFSIQLWNSAPEPVTAIPLKPPAFIRILLGITKKPFATFAGSPTSLAPNA